MKILAISGSLRARSSNAALLRASASVVPEGMALTFYEGLAGLPHFNPDLDGDDPLPPGRDLRAQLAAADGLLVSSPEYAHGVPSVRGKIGTLGNLSDPNTAHALRSGLDALAVAVRNPPAGA